MHTCPVCQRLKSLHLATLIPQDQSTIGGMQSMETEVVEFSSAVSPQRTKAWPPHTAVGAHTIAYQMHLLARQLNACGRANLQAFATLLSVATWAHVCSDHHFCTVTRLCERLRTCAAACRNGPVHAVRCEQSWAGPGELYADPSGC